MWVPGESTELWEGTDMLLTDKSQASEASGLFLGGKFPADVSPHWGCSLGSTGRGAPIPCISAGHHLPKALACNPWVGCT